MNRRVLPHLLFALLPAFSQSYVFVKIAGDNTARPDGKGQFNIGGAFAVPSFDGQWVVFREYGPANDLSAQAIWSFNIVTGEFHKLADFSTPVPGGVGTFKDLQLQDTAPVVRNGVVIFVGRDSNPNRTSVAGGIYSVPAAGAPITKLADYNTPDPSGGTFAVIDSSSSQVGAFQFDGTTVVFQGRSTNGNGGVYSVKPDGSSLALLADVLHPYQPIPPPGLLQQVLGFRAPAVSGSNIIVDGTTGLDPSTGYNGLYNPAGGGSVTEQLNSNQQLPGNSNSNFHTRYLGLIAMDGSLVAFTADDSNSFTSTGSYHGLYTTTIGSHTINRIADVNSNLPGLGPPNAIAAGGVSVSQGNVLFRVSDTTPGSTPHALYLWKNGTSSRIVGTGDTLDGVKIPALPGMLDPGPGSLSGSSFAFNPYRSAIYVATPSSNAMSISAVINAASGITASVAPGEVVTLFGSGLGPANLAYYKLDTNNRLPTQISGVRILFNGYPAPLIYVRGDQCAAIVPLGIAANGQTTAQIEVGYNGNFSAAITAPITNTNPGLYSFDQSGSGQGAIQNSDGSYNSAANPAPPGSIVVLYLSGLGAMSPAQIDGSLTSGTPPPRLQFPATVTIGGQPAQIVYEGPAPGAVVGLYQINCVIPAGTPSGNASLVVTSDGRPSQANLTVAVIAH